MAKSEIDDIFASSSKKSKTGKIGKTESSKSDGKNIEEGGKKGEKKSAEVSDTQSNKNTKRKAPETVVDPSKALESAAINSAKKQKKTKASSTNGISAEDEEFRDSRGTISKSCMYSWMFICESTLMLQIPPHRTKD